MSTLTNEGNQILLGNADLAAEAMDRQLFLTYPAAYRLRRNTEMLRRLGDEKGLRNSPFRL